MKRTLLVLGLATAAISLTACGGGGHHSVDNVATPVVNNSANNTNTNNANAGNGASNTASNTTNTANTAKTGIQGNIIAIKNHKAGNNTAIGATKNIASIVINGQAIDFIPAGFSVGSIDLRANNMARVGSGNNGRNLIHSYYGYLKEGTNGTPHLFSQGNVTTAMPQSGKANYTGNAVNVSTSADGKSHAISTSTANFSVDFGAKTLTGQINSANKVELAGTIKNNGFSGTKNGITTNGYFYGNNAAELGGTYKNANGTISGAYGAKKQ